MPEKDYSGTPLSKKLGLKPGMKFFVGAAPYPPSGAKIGAVLDEFPNQKHPRDADVELYFTTKRETLADHLPAMKEWMKPDGAIWVAWPKRSSPENERLENDLTFEEVQRIGLDAGLVDNKSCSIDENWQALRFVSRLKDRPEA